MCRFALPFAWLALAACPSSPPATLELTSSSKAIALGQPTKVKAVAVQGDGTAGIGTVHFASAAGSLIAGADAPIDPLGVATMQLACEPDCLPGTSITVKASWSMPGSQAEGEISIRVGAALETLLATCDKSPLPDDVTVIGTAEPLGQVDIHITKGNSAGVAFRETGGQFFTSGNQMGTPKVGDVGLWLYPPTTRIEPGVQYDETNANQVSGKSLINFRLSAPSGPGATCPPGKGFGSLLFDRVMFWSRKDGGVTSGAYLFSCPDAGIDVRGCFAYH